MLDVEVDFIGLLTEDVDVLRSYGLEHLHISSVQSSYGYGSVYHHLHVSCSAGFLSCKRDLFGYLGGGHEMLSHGYTVVLKEQYLQLL